MSSLKKVNIDRAQKTKQLAGSGRRRGAREARHFLYVEDGGSETNGLKFEAARSSACCVLATINFPHNLTNSTGLKGKNLKVA